MAADVDRFMAARGLASALVIGHSMGGKTAMQLALHFPQRVRKLVVGGHGAARLCPGARPDFCGVAGAGSAARSQTRAQMDAALAPEIPNPVLRRFLLKNLGRTRRRVVLENQFAGHCAELLAAARTGGRGGAVCRAGAVSFAGANPSIMLPEDEPLIREWFPAAEIQTIAEAGHWVHADQPEEFLRLVLDFFAR